MKFIICLNSILIFLFTSHSFAQTVKDVHQCLVGIHGTRGLSKGSYTGVLLSGNKLGGSLLVQTKKGSEIFQGVFEEKEQKLNFEMIPPGQKLKVTHSYQILENNELIEQWWQENSKDRLSSSRKITAKEASTLAGPKSEEVAQARLKDVEGQWLRLKAHLDNQESINQSVKAILGELQNLESCKKIPNKPLQNAASIEQSRLEILKNNILGLKAKPESSSKEMPAPAQVQ